MEMLVAIVLFVLGIIGILKGADWLTEGASSVARRFRVSTMIIGLTIVAFGTSMPELVVSMLSALQGKCEMSIGNVIGSNIFNTFAIMGVTALVCPIMCKRSSLLIDMPINIIISLFLVGYLCVFHKLDLLAGIILLLLFTTFLTYTIVVAKRGRRESSQNVDLEGGNLMIDVVFILLGFVCLIVGGEFLVRGASDIARMLNISESVIALTIVSAGTSFPELATSVVAARKGDTDMAVGNVIGSNIFNILFILGTSSTLRTLNQGTITTVDMTVLLLASVLIWICSLSGKSINRKEGLYFVICMIAYYVYLVY